MKKIMLLNCILIPLALYGEKIKKPIAFPPLPPLPQKFQPNPIFRQEAQQQQNPITQNIDTSSHEFTQIEKTIQQYATRTSTMTPEIINEIADELREEINKRKKQQPSLDEKFIVTNMLNTSREKIERFTQMLQNDISEIKKPQLTQNQIQTIQRNLNITSNMARESIQRIKLLESHLAVLNNQEKTIENGEEFFDAKPL